MRGGDCRRFAEPSLESARETREIPEKKPAGGESACRCVFFLFFLFFLLNKNKTSAVKCSK